MQSLCLPLERHHCNFFLNAFKEHTYYMKSTLSQTVALSSEY